MIRRTDKDGISSLEDLEPRSLPSSSSFLQMEEGLTALDRIIKDTVDSGKRTGGCFRSEKGHFSDFN